MSIDQYYKKQLFGSVDKGKLPGNLTDYRCELVIEEYGPPHPRQELHLAFNPIRPQLSPFRIELDSFVQPKNAIHSFHIQESEKETGLVIGEKQEYKVQTAVTLPPRANNHIEELDQSRSEYYPDDEVEDRFLELGDDSSSFSSDQRSSSKCVEPSQADKGQIRGEIIEFLRSPKNRYCKPRDMKEHLQRVGFKVAENRVRKMMNEVCRESDRKSGYLLKEIFLYDK